MTAPSPRAPTANRLPIVLLPGHLCSAHLWQPQADRLSAQGHEVHVLPLAALDSVASLAQDVLLRAPPRFQLVGFSMGGYVALDIMRQAAARVARLALISTTAYADTPQRRAQRMQSIALARNGHYQDVLRLFVTPPPDEVITPAKQALIDDVHAMMSTFGEAHFIAQHTAIAHRPDATGLLAGIRCPVGIFYGEADLITPPGVHHALARALPDALCVGIPEAGHMAPMERPDIVSVLLDAWLQWPAPATQADSTGTDALSEPGVPAGP